MGLATTEGALPAQSDNAARDRVVYDDKISRYFVIATIIWGIFGMAAGVFIALQLPWPEANLGKYFTFGRWRHIHTNAVVFAFAGNAIFAAIYYSLQRLLKARMWNDGLSWFHFWGWQAGITLILVSYAFGMNQTHEYAEFEWPLDIAVAIVWIVFAINFFMTIKVRREKHLYVAIWFYIATVIAITLLHVLNNLAIPVTLFKSYPVFSGVQDALMQWWYGHNAVAFFLTTPFLGLMYYFLPKAAERPIFSYKLSILHFWSLVFIYIWTGPHHLHYTALPEWAASVGMIFSIMLWMPSWGGMLNGLLTLRGAWNKLRESSVLKFFVVGITFYGMATFEGPMLSIKTVNSLSHYTDWTISHVHSGALGWNGFLAFGMIYWLIPRLWQTKLYSEKLANAHFWTGTLGIVLYLVAMYSAGITQGLMWRAFDETGRLMYPDFMETVTTIVPMYWVRMVGGLMYLGGVFLLVYNLWRTVAGAPDDLPDPEVMVASATWRKPRERARNESQRNYDDALFELSSRLKKGWHRILEGWPLGMTVLAFGCMLVGTIFELAPMLLIRSNVPRIASVKPYTPLELEGRDIYIREGCVNCHSQMVRPLQHEIERYGEYSKPGEHVYEHPFLWGSKRTGPDLARVGAKYPDLWHVRHMEDPRSTTPGSLMPPYPWLLEDKLDLEHTDDKLQVLAMLGVPYSPSEIENAQELARVQADEMAAELVAQQGPAGLADREIIALVAYLQRLGRDIVPVVANPATDTGPSSRSSDPARGGALEGDIKLEEPAAPETAPDGSSQGDTPPTPAVADEPDVETPASDQTGDDDTAAGDKL